MAHSTLAWLSDAWRTLLRIQPPSPSAEGTSDAMPKRPSVESRDGGEAKKRGVRTSPIRTRSRSSRVSSSTAVSSTASPTRTSPARRGEKLVTPTEPHSAQEEEEEEETECPICCREGVPLTPLECCASRSVCAACLDTLTLRRRTMSGRALTGFRCPFCQRRSGTHVGDCPDGTMSVTTVAGDGGAARCAGFPRGTGVHHIRYAIAASVSASRVPVPGTTRHAFLPATPDGDRLLALLRLAFDRRLVFTVGHSVTNGTDNQVVWAIHHKTSLDPGAPYGYPDPHYLQRLEWELKERLE